MTARRVRRAATAVLLAGTIGVGAGCEPAPCTQPFPTAKHQMYGAGLPPLVDFPVAGEVAVVDLGFDTDGDGVRDTASPTDGTAGPAVTVHRASGDLVLTAPSPVSTGIDPSGQSSTPLSAGDLDGDGLSDVFVRVHDPAGVTAYVVPGSTPAGTHDVTTIGYGVPPEVLAPGDVTGDGLADLLGGDSVIGTYVASGRGFVAAGPGPFDPYAPTFELIEVPGRPTLQPIVPLTDEVNAIATGDGGSVTLWTRGGSLSFGADPAYWPPDGRPVSAWILHGDDGSAWLVSSNGHRNLAYTWAWDLGNRCGPVGEALGGA